MRTVFRFVLDASDNMKENEMGEFNKKLGIELLIQLLRLKLCEETVHFQIA